jgi:hypothetical protein
MAKRRRSENRPLCISVQGHSRSNPSFDSDRHAWVSYRHLIQTLVVTRSFCEIIALKVGIFWRSMEWHDWENQTVLSGHKYIFGKLKQSPGKRRLNFVFSFNRFVTASENVTTGREKMPIFRCFLLAVTWFFDFFQIFQKNSKLDAGRHVRADFHVNRSGDSFN